MQMRWGLYNSEYMFRYRETRVQSFIPLTGEPVRHLNLLHALQYLWEGE